MYAKSIFIVLLSYLTKFSSSPFLGETFRYLDMIFCGYIKTVICEWTISSQFNQQGVILDSKYSHGFAPYASEGN